MIDYAIHQTMAVNRIGGQLAIFMLLMQLKELLIKIGNLKLTQEKILAQKEINQLAKDKIQEEIQDNLKKAQFIQDELLLMTQPYTEDGGNDNRSPLHHCINRSNYSKRLKPLHEQLSAMHDSIHDIDKTPVVSYARLAETLENGYIKHYLDYKIVEDIDKRFQNARILKNLAPGLPNNPEDINFTDRYEAALVGKLDSLVAAVKCIRPRNNLGKKHDKQNDVAVPA